MQTEYTLHCAALIAHMQIDNTSCQNVDRLERTVFLATLDSCVTIPMILKKNQYQAGRSLQHTGLYSSAYYVANGIGYWSTYNGTTWGLIQATIATLSIEMLSRPMLTRSVPTISGSIFLCAKEACYWIGVSESSLNLKQDEIIKSFTWQLIMSGMVANVPDLMAGQAMANNWSIRETLWWSGVTNKHDFAKAYLLSCPIRIASAVCVPWAFMRLHHYIS